MRSRVGPSWSRVPPPAWAARRRTPSPALGARVILVGRSEERLAAVRDALVAVHGEDRFPIVVADMGSLDSVRAAVERVLETESRLDVLVDNAGAIFPERIDGPDGIEATLATLVVGPFALVLGPPAAAPADGGFAGHRRDLGWHVHPAASTSTTCSGSSEPFSGPRAYARAKRDPGRARARVGAPARAVRASPGIAVNAMHPGWADTPGLAEALPSFHRLMGPVLRSPAEGADTLVWLAAAPEAGARSGGLFLDRRPRPFDRFPGTRLSPADRRRLWEWSWSCPARPTRFPKAEAADHDETALVAWFADRR